MMVKWTAEEYQKYLKSGKQPGQKHNKKSKYHARSAIVDGIRFPSEKEADYYVKLKLLTQAGEIKGFCRQPRFVVTYGDENNACTEYVSDFIIFLTMIHIKLLTQKGLRHKCSSLK